ncbi:hypothetical protein TW86_10575 [Halomonas sp. S2151]|uniref:ogr/Delta-like zinc finger family protein n=1 Tax=Halomonas sp. S2151 TaxID=579478 RepID=UPI0005FA6530|nr:ogr/Delta-like zinc finger family protein [Halomonas sp. S2151]KJZ14025.1 hypothetical protein TW86_10575 [Halomonas sp. S2151]
MRITCPHCRSRLATRTSKRPIPALVLVYAQCTNLDCGWGGKMQLEFATTTAPSRQPNPDVCIPIDPGLRRWVLEQIND